MRNIESIKEYLDQEQITYEIYQEERPGKAYKRTSVESFQESRKKRRLEPLVRAAYYSFYEFHGPHTKSIRDKIEQLRRAKQKRYRLLCNELDQEIHQKSTLSRDFFNQFETAVACYQRETESPDTTKDARKDFQRSLQSFDDLERELTTISSRFEASKRQVLDNFAHLNDTKVDTYDEYLKFQNKTLPGRGKKRSVDEMEGEL